jgi:hypothetical protein
LAGQCSTNEASFTKYPEPIDLEGHVKISLEEFQRMGEIQEEEGEVLDLYHEQLLAKKQKQSRNAPGESGESTPTKNNQPMCDETLRRSPRSHAEHGSVFIIVKLCITDLNGVDQRLDVPKVLILAHSQTEKGQTVTELQECLEDTSNERLAVQFDFCKLIA